MKKRALNEADLDLIKKYLTAGAAVGGSAALFTSLLNTLNDIKAQSSNPIEDHTLKLVVKNPKAENGKLKMANTQVEESPSLLRGPLAMSGGVLATIGSYALVRHLYQKIKQQQLEKELKEAQDKYITNLETSADSAKYANANSGVAPTHKPMGLLETITSAPLAASLLLALGSGVVSYNVLKKSFPNLKRKSRDVLGPKRVQVVYDKPGDEVDEVVANIPLADLEKTASANAFLINTVAGFGGESDVSDIVNLVSAGASAYVKTSFAATGINGLLKNANALSLGSNDVLNTNLASNWCARDSGISPSLLVLAASEFADKAPLFFKSAAILSEELQQGLIDLVANVNFKIAANTLDKIKDVELELTEDQKEESNNIPDSSQNIDPQELLELLLASRNGAELDTDKIADLQTEDSEEAGQD